MAFDEYPLATTTMTADDVLAVLIEQQRLRSDALWTSAEKLSAQTTIAEWLEGIEMASWREAGKALNFLFDITLALRQWKRVLDPPAKHTVGEVCDLVSRHAMAPRLEPVTVLGDTSLAAGAFVALRRMLAESGVDVSELRPSSPLGPYLRRHHEVVYRSVMRLAPGRSPAAESTATLSDVCGIAMLVSWLLFIAASLAGTPIQKLICGTNLVLFRIAAILADRVYRPHYQMVGVQTFRDLARVIAGERSRDGPGFPVIVGRCRA